MSSSLFDEGLSQAALTSSALSNRSPAEGAVATQLPPCCSQPPLPGELLPTLSGSPSLPAAVVHDDAKGAPAAAVAADPLPVAAPPIAAAALLQYWAIHHPVLLWRALTIVLRGPDENHRMQPPN
jgi:hypothetical protein